MPKRDRMTLLERAYKATGAGPWCWGRGRSPVMVRARTAVWRYLHDHGMSYARIGRKTGHDHSTITYALAKPRDTGRIRTPQTIKAEAERLVCGQMGILNWSIWERDPDTGRFYLSHGRVEARRRVWVIMHRELSYPEIARACGLTGGWTSIVESVKRSGKAAVVGQGGQPVDKAARAGV